MNERKIRVLIAKPGLDGHNRGALTIASALRDSGMEVIYTGLRRTTDEIVNTVIEEDVDVLGLSIMTGAHLSICSKIKKLLDEENVNDILWLVGGIVPDDDIPKMMDLGVHMVSGPGTSIENIVNFIKANVRNF
jgi:methylmalonyl-CoA mutase, C-terminal domain